MDPVGKESTHTNPTPSRMGLTTIFSSNGALRPLDNPANIYSPITFSRATPSKFIGLTSLSEKENERPTTPLESQSRKQKLDEHAPMGIKAKRLKKLAEQLPDLGSVEDIMKMQEELNQQQAKVKTLEESAASYQKTVEEQQKETITLRSENDKLNDEVKVVQQAKETAITEVAAKTSLINEMEQEKVKLLKDLDDYKDQLHQVELQNEKHIQESKEHQKRSELLDATLKESAAQYMIQQLHQKEFIQELDSMKKQNSALQEENATLKTQMTEQMQHHSNKINMLDEQLSNLKKEYFFAVALAIKLNLFNINDVQTNVEIHSLYEAVLAEAIPTDRWSKWLLTQLDVKAK